DSPMASMFFTIFLLFFLFNYNAPYIEALAIITFFKYGIWAVIMNVLTLITACYLNSSCFVLIFSYACMAIQCLLYAPFYKIKIRHLVIAAIWTLHNDVIDYVFGMMPMYASLTDYINEIGYFTFLLSVVTIFLTYKLTVKKDIQEH